MNSETLIEKTTAASNETLASSVYFELKEDILTGKLKPGQKLRLQALKTDYKVGNSPLREALNRLSARGMVVREENKGFHVASASAAELEELIRTRCWLEEIAIRESIKNADDAYDERIVLTVYRLSRIGANQDGSHASTAQQDLHREFHQALLVNCNSSILLGYCAQLHEQTLRYRNLSGAVDYQAGNEGHEHKAIRDAILDRDADKAVDLLNSHYRLTADTLIKSGKLN